jgi:hypothetical protein
MKLEGHSLVVGAFEATKSFWNFSLVFPGNTTENGNAVQLKELYERPMSMCTAIEDKSQQQQSGANF